MLSDCLRRCRLDALVAEGIQLTRFYAFKYCSPSRSAFISGRNPIHVNVVNGQTTLQNPTDPVSGFSGTCSFTLKVMIF